MTGTRRPAGRRRPSLVVAVTVLAVVAATVAASGQAHAQADLLLYVPNATTDNVSVFRTNADGTLTAVTTIAVGTSPQGVAVRGDQAFAYVTNSSTDTVSVIDTKTQTVVQTFAVGDVPFGAALSQDGTRLYVANLNSNTVSVLSVNATTGQLSAVSTLNATDPRNLVVSPDGSRLYVVNQGADNVQVFNTATNAVVATITVGDQPLAVAINPAGTRVYVTNFNSDTVSVIDTATNTVAATVAVGDGPHKVIVSPDGTKFYVTNQTAGTVSQLDASTNTAIAAAIASGAVTQGIGINPNGTFLYTTNDGASDNVAIFSIGASGALTAVTTIAAGDGPNSGGLCGNASAMLASGGIFVANTAGALNCAGSAGPTFTGGTLLINSAGLALTSAMTLGSAGGTVDTSVNASTVSGVISGSGGLTKAGTGTLTLSGTNTYSGPTTISAGTLAAGAANAFGASSAATVAGGATLALADFAQALGSLAGAGGVTLGAATLTAGGDNTSTTFSGIATGTGALAKVGTGTLTLSGANTYTGTTVVNAGALNVSGTVAGPVSVASGATLTVTASGTVTGLVTVTCGGTLVNNGTLTAGSTSTCAPASAPTEVRLPETLGAASIVTGLPVRLPASGVITLDVTLTNACATVRLAKGTLVTDTAGAPFRGLLHPAATASAVIDGGCIVTSSSGSDLRFTPPAGGGAAITVTLPLSGDGIGLRVVHIDAGGALRTLGGTVAGSTISYAGGSLGTYAAATLIDLARASAAPSVTSEIPVRFPAGSTGPLVTLTGTGGTLVIPAGTSATVAALNAPFLGTLAPPSAVTIAGFASAATLVTNVPGGIRFDKLVTLVLPLPAGDDTAFVPVSVAADGPATCLTGTLEGSGVSLEIAVTGTYALLGAARPEVTAVARAFATEAGYHARWAGQSAAATLCPGQAVEVTVRVRNTGDLAWIKGTPSQAVLGSNAAPGNTRDFDRGILVFPLYGRDRYATHAEMAVAPGEVGTFTFRLRAPASPGAYPIYLRAVIEGTTWMEDEGIFWEMAVR